MTNIPAIQPQLAFIESPMQLLLIFLIIFVLFGAKKMPQLAKDLGKGIREFKKSINGESDDEAEQPKIAGETACSKCGVKFKTGTKFCTECGTKLG